jgi:hypothetical protein
MNRVAIFILCLTVFLVGPAASAQADTATQLPFPNGSAVSIVVDPSGGHVFVSGGPGSASVVVLNYSGAVVKTIAGEGGAAGMALDTATHTLFVALHDQTAISEINTQTLTETKRFSTAPYSGPSSLVVAGGKLWFSCFEGQTGCLASANLDGSGLAAASGISGFSTFPAMLAAGGSGNHLLALADRTSSPPNIAVYDVSGAAPSLVKQIHADGSVSDVESMTFTPSGANLLLATGAPYFIQSLATSTLLPSGQYPTGPYPDAVAVTGDGKYVAGGVDGSTGSNDVFVYPAGATTPVRTWAIGSSNTGSPLTAGSLAFSPDASRLFAVTQDAATGHLVFDVLDQPTIPLKPSTTSVTSSTKMVRYGSHASLKVHMTGPASGKVDLYATTSAQTKQLVATASIASGAAAFTVTPKENTTYFAQFEQGSGYASSTSGTVRVDVAPALSITTRADGKAKLRGHRVSRTLFTAKVNPARPSEPLGFVVQRHVGHRWRTTASGEFPIALTGTVRAFFYTNKAGQCRVRILYSGDSDYVAGKSAWKKFRARSPR